MLLPALAIAGWWYWRNFTLYGEWLGAERLLTITGLRTTPLTWRGFVGEMNGLRYSFWGLFGWFNIILPAWIYQSPGCSHDLGPGGRRGAGGQELDGA